MRRKGLLVIAAVGLIAVVPASADQIIYFRNGSSLPVRGHVLEGEMLKVDLGDDGMMAFPRSVVERIVESDSNVEIKPATANRIVGGSALNRVYATPPPERDGWMLPADGEQTLRDGKGMAVTPMFPGTDHGGKAKLMKVAGANSLQNRVAESPEEGRPGGIPVGVGHKIDKGQQVTGARKKNMQTLSKKPQ